jgi:hypothetical protein
MNRIQATNDAKAQKLREFQALVLQIPPEHRAAALAECAEILRQSLLTK